MLMIRLNAASNVSVILLANPHQANKLVKRMNGHRILSGTNGAGCDELTLLDEGASAIDSLLIERVFPFYSNSITIMDYKSSESIKPLFDRVKYFLYWQWDA
jgi:hypothetical protein